MNWAYLNSPEVAFSQRRAGVYYIHKGWHRCLKKVSYLRRYVQYGYRHLYAKNAYTSPQTFRRKEAQ